MRVVIDLQSAQSANRLDVVGRNALALAQALARQSFKNEVMIVLSDAFYEIIEEIRIAFAESVPNDRIRVFPFPRDSLDAVADNWTLKAAEQIREAFIADLRPDVVLVLNLFEGFIDEAVVSIGSFERSAPTVVLLHDLLPLQTESFGLGDQRFRDWYYRQVMFLRAADRILTASPTLCAESINLLQLEPGKVVDISGFPALSPHSESLWDATARRTWTALDELLEERRPSVRSLHAPVVKPRLAYFSPLPPAQSGIADYSAALLPELAFFYDIDVIVDQPVIVSDVINACFVMRDFAWFEQHADEYDRVLYHFGNSPFHHYMLNAFDRYPGAVVLHDFYLGHLRNDPAGSTADYLGNVYESHGYGGVVDALTRADREWLYPVNLLILARAHGVIVHSNHAIEQARKWYGDDVCKNIRKVPFLRSAVTCNRAVARARLGFDEQDFVVCSFGQLGPAKLNDRLLLAWAASRLTRDQKCKLVFVGNNASAYFNVIKPLLEQNAALFDIHVTGFTSPEQYRDYLDAADVAVQLRTDSRGETSAAVFDCMAHETALIVNAHGSMIELPHTAIVSLPELFTDTELVSALEELWLDADFRQRLTTAGSEYLKEHHAPHAAAAEIVKAIEFSAFSSPAARRTRLIGSIAAMRSDRVADDDDALLIARTLDEALPDVRVKSLFIDVSAVARIDLKTGIQRVTRALLLELLRNPPQGWRVEPVFLSEAPLQQFHYARAYTGQLLDLGALALDDEPVRPLAGDILLGLDLYWDVCYVEPAYARWRALGVSIQFVIYDILPILQPEHFPGDLSVTFERWLSMIARVSDGLLCISKAVAADVATWVSEHPSPRIAPLRIEAFPLGADIQTSAPSKGMPADAADILRRIASAPSVLMVGTVEPRKKHIQALDAMEQLWARGVNVQFVIVGKQGWLTDSDAARLQKHKERGRRFFWLSGVSDEFLEAIYKASTVLLAASSGEGFGLPLIEAASHEVPIIARDLPVFREVAGESATYFSGDDTALADAIAKWLVDTDNGRLAQSTSAIKSTTWEQSARVLEKLVLDVWATANRGGRVL